MSSTLPRRAVAATAIAVTALGGAAFVGATSASAHPHHNRLNTKLAIKAFRRTTSAGDADLIGGHLSSRGHRVVNQVITLQDKVNGTTGWTADGSKKTNRHGNVYFGVSPTERTAYRVVFGGNPNFQPSKSHAVTIGVRDDSLSLSSNAGSVNPGGSATLTGVLTSDGTGVDGASVVLHGRTVGKKNGKVITTGTTDSTGTVMFTVTPGVSTAYRLTFAKTATLQTAYSRVVRVTVRQPSNISIDERHTKKGDLILGQLRGGGHGLGYRKVTLLSEAPGATAYTVVATKKTNKNGYYSFLEPTSNDAYETSFAGGSNYEPCSSI